MSDGSHSFLEIDLGVVRQLYKEWAETYPLIKPHFAVKCHPDPLIIQELAHCGAGFDAASGTELRLVKNLAPTSSDIIYAHTCKLPKDLQWANDHGIYRLTADSLWELEKISRYAPRAEVLIRIACGDPHAKIPFGTKFGATPDMWPSLLQHATDLGQPIVGVSFHVGSGSSSAEAYATALARAHAFIDMARTRGHPGAHIVDVGGGFMAPLDPKVATTINAALKAADITYIAEPGRYFVETACTYYAEIIGKRISSTGTHEYWINDSQYGCFADVAHGYLHPVPEVVTNTSIQDLLGQRHYSSIIYGITCDGNDIICKDALLPHLHMGDWIRFKNMGAYTVVLATGFNGMDFYKIPKKYLNAIQ